MTETVVVVGGGIAGLRCVETLRREGFDGRVMLIRGETLLPYERPPLSKKILTGERSVESLVYRSKDYFTGLDVEVIDGPATGLDLNTKSVLVGSRTYDYDQLVICTGATPRKLPSSTANPALGGVHYLRTADDATALLQAIRSARNVVVVGAGFVGSEVASSARALGADVTIVEAAPIPLARVLGPELAAECALLHDAHGTRLICGQQIIALVGRGRVERAELADGTSIPADLVVVGIGAEPAVGWLAGSGLPVSNGVLCDDRLRARADGVYAVGDVANRFNPVNGQQERYEQWTVAVEQAKYVARQIVDPSREDSFSSSNYFWSEQYGSNLQFVGSTVTDDSTTIWVDRSHGGLFALYRTGDRLTAAFAMDSPRELMRAKALIESDARWEGVLETFPERNFEPARGPRRSEYSKVG